MALRRLTACLVVVIGVGFSTSLLGVQALPVSETFDATPSWDSTYDAPWGGAADFTIESGGADGTCLQAYLDHNASSARVKVYSVPADTGMVISVSMRCPQSLPLYWMETAFRLGNHTGQDFDDNPSAWSLVKKFDGFGSNQNGNSNTWTQYSAYVYTGGETEISIGFKLGSINMCGDLSVTVGWDSLFIQEGSPPPPTPTPEFYPTPTPVVRDFPSSAPEGQLRLVCWNIEFLGSRDPLRTQVQLDLLAARILNFDAAVLVLQEIYVPSTFEYVRSQLGSSWVSCHAGGENALLYDQTEVEALSFERLSDLSNPPYTYYPGTSYGQPVTAVFRTTGGSDETFRVISVHCHPGSESVRSAEGEWLRAKVLEYLNAPGETHNILVMGDYNGIPPCPPHWELLDGNYLHLLPKQNGDPTTVFGSSGIDHCAVTQAARTQLPIESAFVIRPEHYGETPTEFEATYSDHCPIFVEIEAPAASTSVRQRYWQFR